TYHPEHAENLVPCPYCSRGISNEVTEGGHRFPDGREVCGICLESAVLEPEQVREVAMEIRGYLRDLGIDIDPRTFPIELVGRDQLKSIRGLDSNVEGYTKYSVSNQYRSEGGSRSTLRSSLSTVHVYVLTGLPRMRFVGVLTHELMHAWLSSQGLNNTKPEFLEGSCNYVAYRVLENYAGKEAAYERLALESNTDPEYGLGFRRVLTMVQKKGHRHWLQRIQQEQDFPRGF
ncbi:MAG: protein DA1, partial [Candidatus Eisenbacteria bacterium]|nr:protein DA1 [Candidatus Eisenbacteria bacterium]